MSPKGERSVHEMAGEIINQGIPGSSILLTIHENPGLAQNGVVIEASATLVEKLGRDEDEETMGKALKDLEKKGLIEGRTVFYLTEEGERVAGLLKGNS